MEYKYNIDGTERTIAIEGTGDALQVTLDEKTYEVEAAPAGDGFLLMKIDGKTVPVRFARNEQGLHVMLKGTSILAAEPGDSSGSGAGDAFDLVDGKQILVAPMPGQVVKVNVNVGDEVKKKQCCVIVEAMKMENELSSAIDGTVTAVHVEAGQQVDAMAPLVEITQADGGRSSLTIHLPGIL